VIQLLINKRVTGVTVQPDPKWPGMFRVHSAGVVSDIVNLTRAKDAALSIARPRGLGSKERASWKVRETAAEARTAIFPAEPYAEAA
jgi:hypothetical protein